MNFDQFYSKSFHYFSTINSDGLQHCIKQYKIKPCSVIDLGAGEGRNSLYLANQGFDVISIEPSKCGIGKIQEKKQQLQLENIQLIHDDFLSIADSLDQVHFIVAVTSLEHMEFDYLKTTIKKIKDLLRINGLVYIVVFTEDDPGSRGDFENASECSFYIKHYFKKGELRRMFSDFDILFYDEYKKEDLSHGKPHFHCKAKLIARKTYA